MTIVDGKKIAKGITERLKKQLMPNKILAAVLCGDDSSSINFLNQKERTAKQLGVDFRIYKFKNSISQDDLRAEVVKLANLKKVGGIVIQLPLPEKINAQYVLNAVPREKDVDVLGERALGAFYANRNLILSPAVETIKEIFEFYNLKFTDKKIAIVGLGALIGKPITNWLMKQCREIYLVDKQSDFNILKEADLIISGVGKTGIIKSKSLKKNSIVIDFGYSNEDNKMKGDFDAEDVDKLSFYTPTPGGTGPILVAKLFENFYKLCEKQK